MPIPQSDLQKQVKTPNVATGQALDASDMIKQAMAPAFNTINKLNNFGNQLQKFEVAQQRADSQQQAQDAMNAYLAGREQLDTQLHQKTLNDAVAFRDKYYQEADVMHQKFLSQIAAIKDADIRENARQRINSYNMNAASQTEAYVYDQDYKAKDQSLETSKKNSANIAATSVSPLLKNDANIAAFDMAVADGVNDIVNRYTQKGASAEVITAAVQEFKYKAAEQAAQTLAADSSNGYGSVLNFIYGLGANNSLQHADMVKLARKYEDQQLEYEFAKDPEKFRMVGDKYNEALAEQLAHNLTPLERYNKLKLLKEAKAANGSLSAGQYGAIAETDRAFKDYLITDMANKGLAGLLDKKDIVDFLGVSPDDASLDAFRAQQQEIRNDTNKYNPTAIMDLMSMLKAGNNTRVIWNQANGQWKASASRAELKEAAANGYYILTKPTMQNNQELYTRLSSELRRMVQDKNYSNALKNRFLQGVTPNSKEVTDYISAGMLSKMYDDRGWWARKWDAVRGRNVDAQPFTSYVGTMEKMRIAAQQTLKKNGYSDATLFDSLDNRVKNDVLVSMSIAAATSLSDAQLSRIGLQVARDANGNPTQVLNNSQQVLKDFIDVQPEYNIQSATKVLGGINNPAAGAFYQVQDAYTMANHYMEKYARLSREAAEERLTVLQDRIKQERRTAQPKEAVMYGVDNTPIITASEERPIPIMKAGEVSERINKARDKYLQERKNKQPKDAVLSPGTASPLMYGIEDGQSYLKRERPRGRYNLLTGEEGYEYSDYTDY